MNNRIYIMTIVQLAKEINKDTKTIQRYYHKLYPNLDYFNPKKINLTFEQKQKILYYIKLKNVKNFCEQYNFNRFVVEKCISINISNIDHLGKKILINPENEEKILKALRNKEKLKKQKNEKKMCKNQTVFNKVAKLSTFNKVYAKYNKKIKNTKCNTCLYKKDDKCGIRSKIKDNKCEGYINNLTGLDKE